jgi:hypothetical protein
VSVAHVDAGTSLRVRAWSLEEFAASQSAWDDLLARSQADPLFMSWDWQWRWWSQHARVLQATLRLAAVYAGDRLVGVAPFYSHSVVARRVLRSQRLELIGIAWRDAHAMFSDYLDIIAATDCRDAIVHALDGWLESQPFWDELVLCCTKPAGIAAQLVGERLRRWTYVRQVDPMKGWCAQLPSTFSDYVQRLSPEVRRKLFNQRRKLVDPRIEYVSKAEIASTMQQLWNLSAQRWGHAPPPEHVQAFLREMGMRLESTGELRLSRLATAAGPLSILYNIERGGTMYYLQSAFDPALTQGLSPGYLHFGYAIEAACAEGVRQFDFLAGRGRHRDYKRDLLAEPVPVVSYHVLRRTISRALYAAYELICGSSRMTEADA